MSPRKTAKKPDATPEPKTPPDPWAERLAQIRTALLRHGVDTHEAEQLLAEIATILREG